MANFSVADPLCEFYVAVGEGHGVFIVDEEDVVERPSYDRYIVRPRDREV